MSAQAAKFKPTTPKELRRISKRARKRERQKESLKAALKEPKRIAKKRKQELKEIRRAERLRVKAAWKFIEKSKALTRLAKNLPSKIVDKNRKIFLRKYFKILAEKEARSKAAIDRKKDPRHWPQLMPITDKMGVDKPKANEQFVYDVNGIWPQFDRQEMEVLLSAAIGKWVRLPDSTMTWRFVRQCMDQVLGVYDIHEETLGKQAYGLRNPVAAKKLWLRFKKRYYDVGKKVNGKKSKWIDDAAADSEVPSKKRKIEDGPSDSEKSAKKKLKSEKRRDEGTVDFAGRKLKNKSVKEKRREATSEAFASKKSKKDKRVAKEDKTSKRTRLPNLSDETELRRAKGSDVSYRESGKLGKLWAIVPKNYISLSKLTKLAKKEDIEPTIVRQYLSLFRKAGALEVRQ